MNRAALMLRTLERARGGWVSRAELFNDAGVFYLTNNAASECRAKGFDVAQERVNGLVSYRLLGGGAAALSIDGDMGTGPSTEQQASPTAPHPGGPPAGPGSSPYPAQPTLFEAA